ncbi:hypothetical protein MalM25_07250 [Planctomycetes bacterium MalM25]|nr:hypothetical protein MalM25_07250 [Planctomycetes bacterium MalM25]
MLRRQFLRDDRLPFGDVINAKPLSIALATIEGGWVDRIDTPVVTLWVFLGQVLSADHSCRAAVARLLAHRVANDESRCSPETGGNCQARKRLPEALSPKRFARRGIRSTPIRGVGRKAQLAMPRYLTVRKVRVSIQHPGFRTKV